MKNYIQLVSGQILKYIGNRIEAADTSNYEVVFLGYDSYGWEDIWVECKGKSFLISIKEVECLT